MLDYLNAEHLALIPSAWAYAGLLVICFLEGLPLVGSIVAGGTIVFAVGTVALVGVIDPVIAMAVATAGSCLGDLFGFFVLRQYGERVPFLKKLLIGVRNNEGWLSDTFDRRYFMITVVSRLVPFIRSAPSLIAAVRSVPARGYISASILASALWATTGIAAGYGLAAIIDPKYIMLFVIGFCIVSSLIGIYKYTREKRSPKTKVHTV